MNGTSCKRKTRIEVEEERDGLLVERDNLLKRCRNIATERDDMEEHGMYLMKQMTEEHSKSEQELRDYHTDLEEELRGEVLRIEDEQEILQGEFDDMQRERDDLDEELDELTTKCDMFEQERDEALESLAAYEK